MAKAKIKNDGRLSVKPVCRPLGKITKDLEPLIEEMIDGHDLQWGEVLNLIHGYLVIHYPKAQEKYLSGGSPKFHYGEEK